MEPLWIMSAAITVWVSNAIFASGVGLPVGIGLSAINLLFSVATAIMQMIFKYAS